MKLSRCVYCTAAIHQVSLYPGWYHGVTGPDDDPDDAEYCRHSPTTFHEVDKAKEIHDART